MLSPNGVGVSLGSLASNCIMYAQNASSVHSTIGRLLTACTACLGAKEAVARRERVARPRKVLHTLHSQDMCCVPEGDKQHV